MCLLEKQNYYKSIKTFNTRGDISEVKEKRNRNEHSVECLYSYVKFYKSISSLIDSMRFFLDSRY